MKWMHTAVIACFLAGLAVGCSKNTPTAPSAPAGAPTPDEEIRPQPGKMGGGSGIKSRSINP